MKLTSTKIAIALGTAALAAGCSGGGSEESMQTPPAAQNVAPTISSIGVMPLSSISSISR